MYIGDSTSGRVDAQLGLGQSAVCEIVRELSELIISRVADDISFTISRLQVQNAMNGFEAICGLPYCVAAVSGTHAK